MRAPSLKIKFQLPSYDVFELDITMTTKSYDFTIKDLKHKLFDGGFCVSPDKIRLIQSRKELSDDIKLTDDEFSMDLIVEVVFKVVNSENNRHHFHYDEFIRKVEPSDSQSNVSVSCQIMITMGHNSYSHMIFIPALLSVFSDIAPLYDGNMMDHFNRNKVIAARHGYKEWSSGPIVLQERLLLLEVDESLDLRMESIRYASDSALNYEYDRGDSNSWQRYTSQLPVPCKLEAKKSTTREDGAAEDSDETVVAMTPFASLKRNTNYAILLCNNVPTIPRGLQDCELHTFLPCGVCEDRLFMFKTEEEDQ